MGTYVDALFGHSGDARDVELRCRRLEDFIPLSDALEQDWAERRPYALEGADVRLYLYPRVAVLHHPGVTWWAFTRGDREPVRERSRVIARIFGGDRILYLADAAGVVSDGGDDDLEADEAYLRERRGAPTSWEAPPPSKESFRSRWYREGMVGARGLEPPRG